MRNCAPSTLIALATFAGIGWLLLYAHGQIAVRNQGYVPFSDPPINYRSDTLSDPVAKLERQLEQGQAMLTYEPESSTVRGTTPLKPKSA